MKALSKNVLGENETPQNSLVAALLHSYQSDDDDSRRRRPPNETNCTAQLKIAARRVMEVHQEDPNKAEIDLFNLIFRCVGGTETTMLDHKDVDLESSTDEELGDIITALVEDMRNCPLDSVLLCANPMGAGSDKAGHKGSVGAREFRKIFEEFWYQLAAVILSDESLPAQEEGDEALDDGEVRALASSKFQVELVRDIVTRLIYLFNVSVLDIRAASTTAIYQMGGAMLERTVELKAKLEVATRQLNAAKRSKQHRKKEALSVQIDSWKRNVLDLEEVVEQSVMAVFLKRYKDVNPHIRAHSIRTLSRYTLIRPDIYLQNNFLKYIGWLLSDKDARVRENALLALLAPFRENAKKDKPDGRIPIDTNNMQLVIDKFIDRLCDCTIDVDMRVQGVAMELLVVLLRHDLLDSLEDDKWDQINVRAIAPDATPSVRYNAFLFVIEQLEAFQSGSSKSETAAASRINGIVDWYVQLWRCLY